MMKALRRVSDGMIAERGGYTSRQVVADRINGRTGLSLDDIDRISLALQIDRDALISPVGEMMRWVEQNPVAPTPARRRTSPTPRKRAAK
jgi:hypothetical protein